MQKKLNDNLISRADVIVDAMPYFSRYSGKTIVIKYGGHAMSDPKILHTIMQDIAALKIVGVHPVLVHGGGPDINKELEKRQIKSEFRNGLRVTSLEAMEVVESTLCGKVNKNIVSVLNTLGVKAVGISGKDANLIQAERLFDKGVDLGFVGKITKINPEILLALKSDFVPVVASVAIGKGGESYNINADFAAGAIGGALRAEKLLYLTDIDGIRKDEKDPASLIRKSTVSQINSLIKDGAISGGMIPKVQSCVEAIKMGIKEVLITNGTVRHAILLELFTSEGIGTMITA